MAYESKDFEKAIEISSRELAKKNDLKFYSLRARSLYMLKKYKESFLDFEAAYELEENEKTIEGMCLCLRKLNRLKEAKDYCGRVLELNEQN